MKIQKKTKKTPKYAILVYIYKSIRYRIPFCTNEVTFNFQKYNLYSSYL